MKCLIFLFSLLSLNIYAKDYIFKAYGFSNLETIKVSEEYKFSTYTSEGMWDDSNGDYGNENCFGYVKQINNNVDLEVYCETINQNDEMFWTSRIRKSDKGGGVGKLTILNGTGKYKTLIGLECPYGVTYKNKYAWLRAKCNLNE